MKIKWLSTLVTIVLCGFCGLAFADGQDEPIPSYYEEPGLSRNRDFIDQHANERIDPYSGKLQWHHVDLFIPGNGGLDLKVQRSYTSPYVPDFTSPPWEPTLVGLGWTMNYGRVIRGAATLICDTVSGPTSNAVLELPDGGRRILYLALDGASWITTDFWRADCAPAGAGLIVTSPDGTRYEMTAPGHQVGTATHLQNTYYVSKITDRNANWMSFSYTLINSLMAVTEVTTSDGRSITFNYAGGTLDNVTDGSRTWTYIYGAGISASYPYLKEVVRSDGIRWKYDYNETQTGTAGDFSIRKVTYPQGGTIDYTYGFVFFAANASIPRSTVVTQKIANPIGAATSTWTWSYVPATQPIVSNPDGSFSMQIPPTAAQAPTIDTTNVTGPDEARTYYHVGYNSAYQGIAYLIGFSLGTSTAIQGEGYSAAPIQISSQTNVRPGNTLVFDGATAAALVTNHVVSRAGESFITTYSNFDLFGNPQTISETGTNSRTTNLTYFTDATKWIVRGVKKNETITDGIETLAVTRAFDPNANLLSETRAGVATNFTYTPEGELASRTDARLKTTSYLNHFRGIAQTENQPEAVTITRVVNTAGNVSSQTDGELATTGFTFDGLNRVTGITHPLGNPVTVAWAATTRTVTRGAYQEVITYDGFGREINVQHTDTGTAEAVTQNYVVDSLGRRTFASYPNNAILGTAFAYDTLNRLAAVFQQANPTITSWVALRQNQYFSNQIQTTNERNFIYVFRYRSYGDPDKRDLIAVNDPLTNSEDTTITRNIAGQMTAVTQNGVPRSYGYDTHFFLTTITDPETGVAVLGRDAVGNMTSRQVGTSAQTTYGYDDRNRVNAITYPAGTPSVTQTYFKDDKLKSTDNGVARCDYLYDPNKNLTSETLTVGPRTFPSQYAYNGNDALTTLTYGSGRTVTYAPDAFGRPRQASPYVTSVAYHPTGQPSSFTYANGVQTTIGLNPRQWPATLQIVKGTNLFNMNYAYDNLGNVTGISDAVDTSYNRTATYDPLDRLTGVGGPWGSATLGYDLKGNVTSQNFGAFNLTYTYDSATQRLQSVSGSKAYTMNYDVYGNVIANGTTSFVYNDASNMQCANCGLPNEILFDYDGKNQRVRLQKSGVPTFFVYGQGGQLLWEETTNTSLKEYIYLGGKQVATREQPLP